MHFHEDGTNCSGQVCVYVYITTGCLHGYSVYVIELFLRMNYFVLWLICAYVLYSSFVAPPIHNIWEHLQRNLQKLEWFFFFFLFIYFSFSQYIYIFCFLFSPVVFVIVIVVFVIIIQSCHRDADPMCLQVRLAATALFTGCLVCVECVTRSRRFMLDSRLSGIQVQTERIKKKIL